MTVSYLDQLWWWIKGWVYLVFSCISTPNRTYLQVNIFCFSGFNALFTCVNILVLWFQLHRWPLPSSLWVSGCQQPTSYIPRPGGCRCLVAWTDLHCVSDAVHNTQVAEFIIKNAGEYQGPLSSTAVDPFTGKSTSLANFPHARSMHPCCKNSFVHIYTLWVGPLLCISTFILKVAQGTSQEVEEGLRERLLIQGPMIPLLVRHKSLVAKLIACKFMGIYQSLSWCHEWNML